jgi:hypothetical protein
LFCNKCGLALEKPQETKEKNNENPKEIKKSNAPKSVLKSVGKILILLFILTIVFGLVGMIFGTNTSNSPATSNNNNAPIYTQNPSEIVLTLSDLPEGWHGSGSPAVEGDSAKSSFVLPGLSVQSINCNVTKYPTIPDAASQYQVMLNEVSSTTNVGHPSIGDEAYGEHIETQMSYVDSTVFRKGNIIVQVRCLGIDSIDFAKIVDRKIKN